MESWVNIILVGVRNVSDHFRMESSMNLKDTSIANMTFMSCLHHAVANVVS